MTPRERAGEQLVSGVRATPSDSALQGGLWIATSKFVPLAGTVVLSVSIGRVLGPQLLGLQNLVAYVDALLATAIQWVLITLSIRLLAEARGAQSPHLERLTRQAFVINTAGGTLSGLVLTVVGLSSDAPQVWLFAAAAAFLNGIAWGYAVSLVGRYGWTPVARRRLYTQVLAVVLGITAVWVGVGIAGVFAATAVGAALFLIVMRRAHGPIRIGSLTPIPPGIMRLWGTLFVLEVLVQFVAQKSEVLFLQAWADATAVAMYSVAFMVVASSAALPVAMAVAGLPRVASAMGRGAIHHTLRRLQHPVRLALALSVPLAAFVAGVGPSAVLALYGPQFAVAAQIVPAMTLSMLLATGGMVCVTFWVGVNRVRVPLVAGVVAVLLDVALAAALIGPLGVWGAVVANVVAQTVMAVVVLVWTSRRGATFAINWWRSVGLVVCAVLAVLAAHIGVGLVGSDSAAQRWLALLSSAAIIAAVVAGYGALFGLVDPRDVTWLHDALPVPLRPVLAVVAGVGWRRRTRDLAEQASSEPDLRAPGDLRDGHPKVIRHER